MWTRPAVSTLKRCIYSLRIPDNSKIGTKLDLIGISVNGLQIPENGLRIVRPPRGTTSRPLTGSPAPYALYVSHNGDGTKWRGTCLFALKTEMRVRLALTAQDKPILGIRSRRQIKRFASKERKKLHPKLSLIVEPIIHMHWSRRTSVSHGEGFRGRQFSIVFHHISLGGRKVACVRWDGNYCMASG